MGSSWLIDSLSKLHSSNTLRTLGNQYTLVNLSSIAGYYERDAYEYEVSMGKCPLFYLSDLCGNSLLGGWADVNVAPHNFIKLVGNNDACSFDIQSLKLPADIILDIKGALWHVIEDRDYISLDKVKALFDTYSSMLGKDGVLIVDSYKGRAILGQLEKDFGNKLKKEAIFKHFCECSTHYTLTKAFGKKIRGLGKYLHVGVEDNAYPLAKYMNTVAFTRDDLIILKDMLDCMSDSEVRSFFK